jgi:hypothetical protein
MSELINCPPLTFEQFMAIPNGTRVFNYGADQCVALANQYHVGTLNGVLRGTFINSAFQWWTDFEKYPQLTSVYSKVLQNPQRGDIFVTRPSLQYDPVHGHIGVVERDWDGSTFGTIEQNAGSGVKRWAYRYNRGMSNIYGFLRPINSGDEMNAAQDAKLNAIYDALFKTTEVKSGGYKPIPHGVLGTLSHIYNDGVKVENIEDTDVEVSVDYDRIIKGVADEISRRMAD